MEIGLEVNKKPFIRPYKESDLKEIQDLNKEEGWTNLVENHLHTMEAWENSNVAFVVEKDVRGVVGYIRGFTDTRISLFICELLIKKEYRGFGLGKELLQYVHEKYPDTRIEMLANSSSRSFYEGQGYRTFYGFRKSFQE